MTLQSFANAVDHSNTDAPLCYFHIPRTAGARVYAHLKWLFEEDEILSPGDERCSLAIALQLTHDQLHGRRVLNGPYANEYCPRMRIPIRYITFLRDPLIRAVSQYESVLRDSSHRLHDAAKSLGSFGAYLRNEATQPSIANCELRTLGATIDLQDLMAAPASCRLARNYLDAKLEKASLDEGTSKMMGTALTRLDQMCLVGLAERFDESLKLLCELFNWPVPRFAASTARSRAALFLDALPPADLRLLERLNEADMELYAAAKARFDRDWTRSRFVYPHMHAFVSYAQSTEDVLLYRALRHIEKGFYVDVGANDPTGDSVTKAFYERGWRGINIEPIAPLYEALVRERPEDINIFAAAGATDSSLTIYDVPGTGLSTLDSAIADRHRDAGFKVAETTVKVRTLGEILGQAGKRDVHFLKIDVEGWELDVLKGMSFESTRPWIIVVEATEPNTDIPSYQAWEPLLLNHGYAFAFFDGLNRYYLAEERRALHGAFSRPVNSGDCYIRASEKQALQSLRQSKWEFQKLNRAVAKVSKWAKEAETYAKSLELERVELKAALATRETENHNNALESDTLRRRATIAEEYARSLEEERRQHELVYQQLKALRDREHSEAITQIEAQKSRAAIAEEYAQSLANERQATYATIARLETEVAEGKTRMDELSVALSQERQEAASALKKWQDRTTALESEVVALKQRLREWDEQGKQHAMQLRQMLESNFRTANAWYEEKRKLLDTVASVERQLVHLRKHWMVRYLVSKRLLDKEEGG